MRIFGKAVIGLRHDHTGRRSNRCQRFLHAGRVRSLRQAKVENVRCAGRIDEHIGRLQIAVNDAMFMGVFYGLANAREQLQRG